MSKDSAKQRWLNGVPEDKKAELIPDGWFEQWADATWALDPAGAKQTPPVLRAPNGVLQDVRTYWIAGKPQYDPADIRVPTLLIHAEWDADLPSDQARGYFAKLANAPYKRYIEIGEGTHIDHHGKEPHAVLPRDHEFPGRARPAEHELGRRLIRCAATTASKRVEITPMRHAQRHLSLPIFPSNRTWLRKGGIDANNDP